MDKPTIEYATIGTVDHAPTIEFKARVFVYPFHDRISEENVDRTVNAYAEAARRQLKDMITDTLKGE